MKIRSLIRDSIVGLTVLFTLSAQLMGAFDNVELDDFNFGVKTVNGDAADVDHDGDLDFLTSQTYFSHLHLTRNDGSSLSNGYITNYANDGKFIDFDGDGYVDIANVFNYGVVGQHGLQLRQNNGSGGFTHLSTMSNTDLGSSLNNINSMAAGDYDADGDEDLILAGSRWNQNAIVLENDGNGNFTEAAKVSWGNGQTNDAVEVQWADFDGDGDLDIMLLAQSWIPNSPLPMVWENTGSGFQPAYTEQAPGIFLWGRDASVADMDGDGDMDIVAQGQSIHGTQNNGILLYENTGAFNFSVHFIYDQTGQSMGGVRAADFDYDGDMDLATTTGTQWDGVDGQRLMLMENVGGLNFISGFEGSLNTGTLATVVNSIPWIGDAEGDGDLEILTGEYYSGYLWGFNSPPPEVCDATVQTFSIIGANGAAGGIDAYTDVSLDGGLTWGPAYLSGGHPWGYIAGTNSWVSINPNQTLGAGTGPYGSGWGSTVGWAYADFRIRFNIPADFSDPAMVFQVKADNEADISLNGTFVQHINGQSGTTVDASIASALQAGENEIILRLGDYGGIWGINYRIDVTMTSCEDVSDPIVVVENPNTAPTANAGADQNLACVVSATEVTFDGSGSSDPDGDVLTYSWSLDGSEVSTTASFTATLPVGSYTYTLTVDDGNGESATDEVLVTVVGDTEAPVLTLLGDNPASVQLYTSYTEAGYEAEDVCDDEVTVVVTGTIDFDTPGSYTLTYTATDASTNASVEERVVEVVNTAPVVANTVDDIELSYGDDVLTAELDLSLVFADADTNDVLSYSFTHSNASAVDAVLTGSILSFEALDLGESMVDVTAVDPWGANIVVSFVVTVNVTSDMAGALLFASTEIDLKKDIQIITGNIIVNEAYGHDDGLGRRNGRRGGNNDDDNDNDDHHHDGNCGHDDDDDDGDDNDDDNDSYSHYELTLAKDVHVASGYKMMANGVKIGSNSLVESDVYANELNNSGDITGQIFGDVASPIFSSLPPFKSAPAGDIDITVGKNESLVLAPGDYGKIYVRDRGTLTFTGGVYNIEKLEVKKKGHIRFEGATEVRVESKMQFKDDVYVGPAGGSYIDASDIIFYIDGYENDAAKLYKDVVFFGTIYAANGKVKLKKDVTFTGAILAEEIKVDKESSLALDSYFGGTGAGLARGRMVAWNEPEMAPEIPEVSSLANNYPNPFNPSTTISFALDQASDVSLTVYDIRGVEITRLASGHHEAGHYTVHFAAENLSSGTYLYVLDTGSFREVKRMVYLK